MHLMSLYFQYTHLSNSDLNLLRTLINSWSGKTQLISSKNFLTLKLPITFGKLLVVKIPENKFQYNMVSDLLSKFKVLHLLFIEVYSFLLSPSLYVLYTTHQLQNIPFQKLYGFGTSLNSIRLILFRIRYLKLTMYLLFQETLLYKNNIQYIC